jgi:hypothetical protein
METEIENLKKENEILKQQLLDTQNHLQKYTNPQRQRKYQEKNKDKILEYAKDYQKTYYQKKKLEKIEK